MKSDSPGKYAPFSKPSSAFGFIATSVFIAIIIVFLILESNQQALDEKRNTSSKTSDILKENKVLLEKLTANPNSVPLNIEVANFLFDNNQFDQAIPFYKKAVKGDPSNIAVQIDLAVCYFNLRQFDQAIVEMEKALKIDPNHPKGLFNMGIIYYNLKQFDKVRTYWEKLIATHPNSDETTKALDLLKTLP